MESERKQPNWEHWCNLAEVELLHAVELSLNLEPGWLRSAGEYDEESHGELPIAVKARIDIAMSHVSVGTLICKIGLSPSSVFPYSGGQREFVSLTKFREWGESLPVPFTFPDEFPHAQESEASHQSKSRWPWGDHETDLLRKLAIAAEKFWKLYDPADATTAPTNQVVIDWLKAKGVAERNAQVMATILRADGLQTGPRK